MRGNAVKTGISLDLVADQRFTANDVEILTVQLKTVPHELSQGFPISVIVLGADHGVHTFSRNRSLNLSFKG